MRMNKLLSAVFLPVSLAGTAVPALAADRLAEREARNICRELREQEGVRCTKVERAAIADLVTVFRSRPAPVSDLDVETRHHEFENMLRVIIPRRPQ